MSPTDLRPKWKAELQELNERRAVLLTKIEAADEIFSNGTNPQKKNSGLPLFPSLSKTVETIIMDHGEAPGLTTEKIIGYLHQYGLNAGNVKKATVYTLAKRVVSKGRAKSATADGQALFLRN